MILPKRSIQQFIIGWALLIWIPAAWAANPGDEVLVVYNSILPASKDIAEHYAQVRKVPGDQVLGLELSTEEDISRTTFKGTLQTPLAKQIADRKLWKLASNVVLGTNNQPDRVEWKVIESKIRYLVLCQGVPLRILPDNSLSETNTENLRPEMRRNEAAVDSELALLPVIEQQLPLAGPLRSPIYASTNAAWIHPTNGVLIVARLDGPTAEVARRLVDKAVAAESRGLWGRAYFDLRSITDPGYKQGEEWISSASEIARRLGFETVVDTNSAVFPPGFPMSHVAYYVGWYTEHISGPLAEPLVEFMPGAFAYHLHSYSAASLRATNRYWAGPLLARGATATLGCVHEPYLAGTPDIGIFTARFLYYGFTFGEAALACQSVLSWQTTVVGDPLYRPFGLSPERQHLSLQLANSKDLEWSFVRLVNLNLVAGRKASDCSSLLEEQDLTKRSAVMAEKLGDLYAALGKPASAVHAWQQALERNPSPQQYLRLSLILGTRLRSLNRDDEAYKVFVQLQARQPDYPQKITLLRHLAELAHKLDRKEDAAAYDAEIARLTPPPQ